MAKVPKVEVERKSKGKKPIIKYKFKPPSATALVRNREKLIKMSQDKKVLDLVVKGNSYEEIGEKLGVPTQSAYELVKSTISKYVKDFALELVEVRELDLMRLTALERILWDDATPHPAIDRDTGKPILDAVTGKPVMLPGDRYAQKMIIDIIERRSKLLGTEAATKMEHSGTVDVIRREYVGADPDKL